MIRTVIACAAAGLILMAGAAHAQSPSGDIVHNLLLAVHGGDAAAFQTWKASAARVKDEHNGQKAKPKPIEASDFSRYLSDCTLFDRGNGEGSDWTLSWKCGDTYRLMVFRISSGKVSEVTLCDGPPWIVNRKFDDIRFPQLVSAG